MEHFIIKCRSCHDTGLILVLFLITFNRNFSPEKNCEKSKLNDLKNNVPPSNFFSLLNFKTKDLEQINTILVLTIQTNAIYQFFITFLSKIEINLKSFFLLAALLFFQNFSIFPCCESITVSLLGFLNYSVLEPLKIYWIHKNRCKHWKW